MSFLFLMSNAQAGADGTPPNPLMQLFPFALMFLILWFMIIRPQRKRQKEMEKMMSELKIHDQIVTTGGIYGTIVNIKKEKNIIVLRVDESTNAKIEIQRSSIAGVIKQEKEDEK
ncbi:MAG: preprotein translocase subunit YajC [Candidatus Cloacimonetes bacterium]|nr:preprotein translocase subunit YajC [Candidatus Cloacimonadota bacterium]